MARNSPGLWCLVLCLGFMAVCIVVPGCAPSQPTSETSPPRPKDQLALLSQTAEETHRKSAGCLSCHGPIETPSMHTNPAVQAGCADCHGGTASVFEATLVVQTVRDGKAIERKTVTASEGAPGRGTFDATMHATPGQLVVRAFSPSAKDGSPQHEVRVHVVVTP